MNKEQLRQKYVAQINKAIDYIEGNIKKELNLKTISDATSFSPFHFHRIFKAFTGETINSFIKRIRIEKAGNLLANNHNYSITQVAFKLGFSSSQAFSREFRAYFKKTPSNFRETTITSKNCYIKSKNWKEAASLFVYDENKGRHILKKYIMKN